MSDKVVPINFRKRAVCQFKMVRSQRNAQNQVISQQEMAVTKIFPPTATLHEVMKYVISKSDKTSDGCYLIFETDNPDQEDFEDGNESSN